MSFEKVKAALLERDFSVSEFATASEAADYLDRKIDRQEVSLGGCS